jgi:hypothetical protein
MVHTAFRLLHRLGSSLHFIRDCSVGRAAKQRLQVVVTGDVVRQPHRGILLQPTDRLRPVAKMRLYGRHAQHVDGRGRRHSLANLDQRRTQPLPVLLLGLLAALFVQLKKMGPIQGKRR